MQDVMIDLETMGSGPDAAIVEIGAVFFDPRTGELGDKFSVGVDLASSVETGGRVDAGTVMWWMRPDQADARDAMLARRNNIIHVALTWFSDFLKLAGKGGVPRVWGNGASFDCVILRGSYERAGVKVPWDWWNDRDVRTVVDMGRRLLGFDPKKDLPFDGVKHSALDDAIHQARYVSEIIKRLGVSGADV